MKISTILLIVILSSYALADDYITSCDNLRIGTKKDATDVMLDGEPTASYKQYRHIRDEDDVEFKAGDNEAVFYIHGIKLANEIGVEVEAKESKLLKVSKSVTCGRNDYQCFELRLNFECTPGLTGVSDVYTTFTLDGNVCANSVVGIRKKCGSQYAYAPIEISEVGWFSKTVLTTNGGQTVNQENVFDDTGIENVVAHKGVSSLTFRVKNMRTTHNADSGIRMLPPIVKTMNEAEDVVYPVLRGAGARDHTLSPDQYEEFKLEFNCISLEKDSELVEVVFRPAYHSPYIFKVTKECEGLTLSNLIKKEFQDSIVFDFFAFVFFFLIICAILMGVTYLYVRYKEYQGETVDLKEKASNGWLSIRGLFGSVADGLKGPNLAPEKPSNSMDDETPELNELKSDEEFDPNDVLNSGKKPNNKNHDEDDFDSHVKVQFDRDDENFPAHELKNMEKTSNAKSNIYGTL